MDFRQEMKWLLVEGGPGRGMKTAYDTAWVARLGDIDHSMSDAALSWISENQLPDGSWGAREPSYYYDRVISTLAAITALNQCGRRRHDQRQIELGQLALERIAGCATKDLLAYANGPTVGFEMIAPTLVAEAEKLGLLQRQGERILGRLKHLREAKLARLNGFRINRKLSIAYSAEMAGSDCQHLLDLDHLLEQNGSVAHSPSATAYYVRQVNPGDPAALGYLRRVVGADGGAPMAAPFDVYESAWVLWNLALSGTLDEELITLCQPHLDKLQAAWHCQQGVGFGSGYSVMDGDDTSLVYAVLNAFGRSPDIEAVYRYEGSDCIGCYALEANPSISTNVHALDVFRRAGLGGDAPIVQKVIGFLRENQVSDGYWLDKWHASPYYTTAHMIIACMDYDNQLAETAVQWILSTWRPDDSWGYYFPTAEETAYALQALCLWKRHGGYVPLSVIHQGAAWLADHLEPPYPPLWIAKSLYCSEWVVRSEILCALSLAASF